MIPNSNVSSNQISDAFSRLSLRNLGLATFLLVAGANVLMGQSPDVIKKIDVIGAQKITKENLLFRVGIKEGDDFRNIDFSSVLEKLWAIDVYDNIKIKYDDEEDGKILIIEVNERPLVKEIDYRGGTYIGLSNIKDKIKENRLEITPDTIYNPETARKIKSHIVDMAGEKGFSDPVIDILLEPMGAGICRLIFEINEGSKARIYKISFQGNEVLSDRRLKKVMKKTRENWIFSWMTSHDLIIDKNIEEDMQNLKNAYLRLGYKDIFVGQPTKDIQDHTTPRQRAKNLRRVEQFKQPKVDLRATLTFQLLEGENFYEGKLAFEGNEKIPGLRGARGEAVFRRKIGEARRDNSWIAKFLNLRPRTKDLPPTVNQPMDFYALNKGIEEIEKLYRNLAYAQASVTPKYVTREENGVKKVDTTLSMREGEKFFIRRISFQGNNSTLDKVLRRAVMPLREGDPFSIETLQNGVLGVNQLGFFEVKPPNFPDVKPVGDKPLVDIVIKGEEAGVNEFQFNAGYGEVFGITLGAVVSTKNLRGGGQTLGASFNIGEFQRAFSVAFTEPYVMDKPFSFGVSLSDNSYTYDADMVGTDYAYREHTRGVGLSTGTRLATFMPSDKWGGWTSFTQIGVGYNFRIIEIEGGHNYYFRTSGSQLTSTVNLNLVFSTVNHPFKPTGGFKLGFGFGYGGWQFGSDRPFYRTSIESSYFKSFADRHVFAFNVSYGYMANLSSQEQPIWENFRPGGENTIRGYRYGWVGTQKLNDLGNRVVVGGNKQFLANLEYQLTIADEFRIVLFHDMGNAWASGHRIFSEDLRRSVGVEFRFFLPISPAPLRLIWAHKLNPYDFDPDNKSDFQFSLGTTF
ncbi:MAG: BamA/TamA family outer membrane protein [Holophagales bacterium]|jgi:outer membrane protein insertion porin family|nr:BamA/TamA family outer membrane protein [Holophagales bacterium]